MDLVGDIGHADQLTSAREESKVLNAKVKELTLRIRELQCENEALKAEVVLYRVDFARSSIPTSSNDVGDCDVDGPASSNSETTNDDDFITSGNGIYPADPAVTLPAIHGPSNPLCCALHPDDTLLATGGADSNVRLCRWGSALAPGSQSSVKAVDDSIVISCGAPVICCAFALVNKGRGLPVIAAGCMDGSVRLAYCGSMEWNNVPGERLLKLQGGDLGNDNNCSIKHTRYVKTLCWSPSEPILASASADGTVQLTCVGNVNNETMTVSIDVIKTMHFNDAVEAMCYVNNGDTLCCYIRGTSYLSYFDLKDGFKVSKMSLNGGTVGNGGFNEHVSFAVLAMQPSPCGGKYIALATDTSRNIIMEVGTERIVRNLYGHKNDSYSNPKIAWSNNGQYLYGNSQDDNCIFVWDIASTSIVKRLDENYGGHGGFVRDICSSSHSDTVVSVSFDKSAKVWLRDV
jgi:WD40 repeat protein